MLLLELEWQPNYPAKPLEANGDVIQAPTAHLVAQLSEVVPGTADRNVPGALENVPDNIGRKD